jgi:2-polyprenyl-3-methyl-5-hydroxy-6-metoxy-1,4-benzoquinol methylase
MKKGYPNKSMVSLKKLLSKKITGKINKAIEMFFPPILVDRKFVASLFNFLQGRGFCYIDPSKDPVNFPRCNRDSDCTPDQIKAVLELISGSQVLDIGCGNGGFVKKLGALGFQATGIDPQVTPDKGNKWRLLKGTLSDDDFPERSFDTVVSLKTLEHIPDAKSALSLWRTFARHRIILLLPCQRYRKFVYDGHINFYPDEYQLKLQLGLQDNAIIKKINGEWLIHEDL